MDSAELPAGGPDGTVSLHYYSWLFKERSHNDSGSSAENLRHPRRAGQALQTAAKAKDNDGIARILGSKGKTLVGSGDPAGDEAAVDSFAKQYERMNRWVAMTDGSRRLYIGASNYPFPIPLAQDASSKWYFNSSAGAEELQARRIGRNELLAMEACRVIANAEDLYRKSAHQYTETIISTPSKQDGLYWEVSEEQPPSPLGKIAGFAKDIFASNAPRQHPGLQRVHVPCSG
jgi:hypothetical protein